MQTDRPFAQRSRENTTYFSSPEYASAIVGACIKSDLRSAPGHRPLDALMLGGKVGTADKVSRRMVSRLAPCRASFDGFFLDSRYDR
jgi:hypothetical protein